MSGGSEDSGSGMEVKADRHRDWVIKPHPVERVNPKP
jgi:hypothetical protein